MRSLVKTLLMTSVLGFSTAPVMAQEKLGQEEARACVEMAGKIGSLQRSVQAMKTELEIIRTKIADPSFSKELSSLNAEQAKKGELFNKMVGEYNTSLPQYSSSCSGKTLQYTHYERVCKRNLDNPFCKAFGSYHKKLKDAVGSGMPPGIPK